jgi:hypothetical protein
MFCLLVLLSWNAAPRTECAGTLQVNHLSIEKEIVMSVISDGTEFNMNSVVLSGRLKNIREFKNERGVMMIAQLTQRNNAGNAVCTMPLLVMSKDCQETLRVLENARLVDDDEYTSLVILSGALNTRFDGSFINQGNDRKPPFTRVVVDKIELV